MPPRRGVYAMEMAPTYGPRRLDESRFPNFHDGEVKIIITGSRQYQLHKSILKNLSPLFRELLSEKNTVKLTTNAKRKGVVVTNLLRASIYHDDENGSIHIELKPIQLDGDGRPISEQRISLDLENGVAVPPIFTAYDKVLGAFYNQPINLSDFGGRSLNAILPNALEVLKVAEYLGCASIITAHFEATLLALGQSVYRAISRDPAAWIDLAIRMQSKTLYRESMIHAAGQWNTQELAAAFPAFDDLTRELLTNMSRGIITTVKENVSFMLSYYPTPLQRQQKTSLVDKDENSRNSYANDILHWHALTIFRHWLGHQVTDDHAHHAQDLGYELMTMMKAGADAYIVQNDLEHWHKFFPMAPRAKNIVKGKLEEIKQHVTGWARKFFINHTKLEVEKYGTGFFTFAKFPSEVYPWEIDVMQEDEEDYDDYDGSDDDGDSEQADDDDGMNMDEPQSRGRCNESFKSNKSVKSELFAESEKSVMDEDALMEMGMDLEQKLGPDGRFIYPYPSYPTGYGDDEFGADLKGMDDPYCDTSCADAGWGCGMTSDFREAASIAHPGPSC